jgi:hypothetical protein
LTESGTLAAAVVGVAVPHLPNRASLDFKA